MTADDGALTIRVLAGEAAREALLHTANDEVSSTDAVASLLRFPAAALSAADGFLLTEAVECAEQGIVTAIDRAAILLERAVSVPTFG